MEATAQVAAQEAVKPVQELRQSEIGQGNGDPVAAQAALRILLNDLLPPPAKANADVATLAPRSCMAIGGATWSGCQGGTHDACAHDHVWHGWTTVGQTTAGDDGPNQRGSTPPSRT